MIQLTLITAASLYWFNQSGKDLYKLFCFPERKKKPVKTEFSLDELKAELGDDVKMLERGADIKKKIGKNICYKNASTN